MMNLSSLTVVLCTLFISVQSAMVQFEKIDTNNDGSIMLSELTKWNKENDQNINIDTAKLKLLFRNYDKNSDSSLNIAEFVPLALKLAGKRENNQAEELFKKLDLNNDSILTRDEADQTSIGVLVDVIDGLFKVADANNDGHIDFNELLAAERRKEKAAQSRNPTVTNQEIVEQIFTFIDRNGDRLINSAELHAFVRSNSAKIDGTKVSEIFAVMDKDKNGEIDMNEMMQTSLQALQELQFSKTA